MLLHPLTPLSPSVSWMLDAELGVGVRHLALKNSDARGAASLPRGTGKKSQLSTKVPDGLGRKDTKLGRLSDSWDLPHVQSSRESCEIPAGWPRC